MTVYADFQRRELNHLLEYGLAIIEPKTYYELKRLKGRGVTAVLFRSGKLFIQGSDNGVANVKSYLNGLGFYEHKKPEFVNETGIVIGSDETLKGDTFGGLVVAGVRANEVERENLRLLGVMDSKKLTNAKILQMAPEIPKIAKSYVISVMPEEYNRSMQTPLLNKLHKEVFGVLKVSGALHVVDAYPGCTVGKRVTKAESKYIEVAAASIIAREAGLQQLAKLSAQLLYDVPKGSTHVKEALHWLKDSRKQPRKFVKMHFKNVQKALK